MGVEYYLDGIFKLDIPKNMIPCTKCHGLVQVKSSNKKCKICNNKGYINDNSR